MHLCVHANAYTRIYTEKYMRVLSVYAHKVTVYDEHMYACLPDEHMYACLPDEDMYACSHDEHMYACLPVHVSFFARLWVRVKPDVSLL